MKKAHLIAIIILAVSIGTIISMVADAGTYASFSTAREEPESEFHVVGVLNKEKEMTYDPQKNANLFSFYVLDKEGNECKVNFNGAKPQDFERSEQIVLTGKFMNNEFYASKILMKCPSKYNDTNGSEFIEAKANA